MGEVEAKSEGIPEKYLPYDMAAHEPVIANPGMAENLGMRSVTGGIGDAG